MCYILIFNFTGTDDFNTATKKCLEYSTKFYSTTVESADHNVNKAAADDGNSFDKVSELISEGETASLPSKRKKTVSYKLRMNNDLKSSSPTKKLRTNHSSAVPKPVLCPSTSSGIIQFSFILDTSLLSC